MLWNSPSSASAHIPKLDHLRRSIASRILDCGDFDWLLAEAEHVTWHVPSFSM
jgi:hypothetical protein